jgi:hypothetical protein
LEEERDEDGGWLLKWTLRMVTQLGPSKVVGKRLVIVMLWKLREKYMTGKELSVMTNADMLSKMRKR